MGARRSAALVVGGLMLAGVVTTASVSAVPVPVPDPCAIVGTVNTTKLAAYDKCRFDRIEAAIPGNQTVTVTAPPVTTTVTTTVTTASSSAPTTPPATPSASTSSAPPAPAGWPDAANTGVPDGVTLVDSGPITVTTPGTVIDGKNITGGVVVRAADVVIKNSRISGGGAQCVWAQSGSVTIQDSEIIGNCENGIGFSNWKAYRVEVRSTYGDGVKLGSNVVLQDSWVHDLAPAAGAHADGGQVQFGVTNLTIRHNVIDLGSTPRANAALFIAPDQGPSTAGPLVIDNNKLNGGNYILFCVDGNNGQYFVGNIRVTDNRFGRAYQYGPSRVNVPITQSGNVWDDNGSALNL